MKHFFLAMTAAAFLCSMNSTAQNKVKNVYTESSTLKVEQVQNIDQTVQVNRYLFAGYNTLCMPMTVSAQQLKDNGVRAEQLVAIQEEGGTLQLLFADCTDEGLEPGVPYLIFSEKKQYLRIKNTDADRTTDEILTIRLNDGQGNQVAFSSSWETLRKDGMYGIPAKQDVEVLESVLIKTTADQAFLPTRCSFSWEQQSATATQLVIRHIGAAEATAIRQLTTDDSQNTEIYDISGRRVSAPTKGINIINGKKTVIK